MNDAQLTIYKKLNPKQKQVFTDYLAGKPVYTILHGAVRSGKTFLGQILWLMHIAKYKNQGLNFVMTGYTISSLKKNVLDDINDNFGIDTKLDTFYTFKMFGNRVLCFGTDKADSYKAMRGFTGYGHYGNEVSLSHRNSIDEVIKRCSGDDSFIWETNPDSPQHYIKKEFVDRSGELLGGGRPFVKAYHFELEDNPRLAPEYVESLKRSTPKGVMYDRSIKGLWVAREGIIYDCFIESEMIVSQSDLPPMREVIAGVDWGFEHFGVIIILGIGWDGNVYVLDITKEQKKDIDWWVAEKLRYKAKYNCNEFWCDSARPEYVLKFNGKEADKAVIEGVDCVYAMFANRKLFVSDKVSCVFLDELYNYVWKASAIKEEPMKENDDIMDALRYAIFNRFGKKKLRNPYFEMARKK